MYKSDNKAGSGVLAGFAEAYNLNVTATRIVFFVACFFFPLLIIAYCVADAVMKDKPKEEQDA